MRRRDGRHYRAGPTLLLLFSTTLALAQATRPVEPTGADSPSSTRNGDEFIELGRLQTELTEFETARENYLAGIELLIEEDGEYSPSLIEPYAELARVFLANQQSLEAITVLEQARHISQRNFGLFNIEQTALLDEMGRAYLLIGDTAEAQNVQRERVTLALRRFGADDPRVIPFHNHLGEYYDRSRMRVLAREQYEAVLAIHRESFGEDDGRSLVPLSELVRIDILLGDSTSARRRLLEVLETSTNATPFQTGNALAVLGDWELSRRRTEAALQYYRESYTTLEAADPPLGSEYFSGPRFIDFVPPPSPVDLGSGRGTYAWGSITAGFRVSANGRAIDISVSAADPSGLMAARYVRRLAEAWFRPRMMDGELAGTAAVSYTHEFRYFVDD